MKVFFSREFESKIVKMTFNDGPNIGLRLVFTRLENQIFLQIRLQNSNQVTYHHRAHTHNSQNAKEIIKCAIIFQPFWRKYVFV